MSLPAIFTNKCSTSLYLSLSRTHFLKSSNFTFLSPNSRIDSSNGMLFSSYNHISRLSKTNSSFEESFGNAHKRSSDSRDFFSGLNFDVLLSILEFFCLPSAAAISIYVAVSCGVQNREVLKLVGSKIFVWQFVALATGVVAGAVIRRRQWSLIYGARYSRGSASAGIISLESVERLEEDLRSLAGIVRALSRQLEKLGIRFRITQKALKEPIAQTMAMW